MIDHMSSYATDFARSRQFYDAAFAALGYGRVMEMTADWDKAFPGRQLAAYGPEGKPAFWLVEVKEPATPRHVAFTTADRAHVDAFYEAGLRAGGKDNGRPGIRAVYHPDYYGAFLIDPDGNNVEAVTHRPE